MCLFIFPLCKFFQNEVQFSMGFLARPVTADHTCYGAGYDEYRDDYEGGLHHMRVPFNLPSMMLIAIAEMKTPASMYNKSI